VECYVCVCVCVGIRSISLAITNSPEKTLFSSSNGAVSTKLVTYGVSVDCCGVSLVLAVVSFTKEKKKIKIN
jgi:hypothetical protein